MSDDWWAQFLVRLEEVGTLALAAKKEKVSREKLRAMMSNPDRARETTGAIAKWRRAKVERVISFAESKGSLGMALISNDMTREQLQSWARSIPDLLSVVETLFETERTQDRDFLARRVITDEDYREWRRRRAEHMNNLKYGS